DGAAARDGERTGLDSRLAEAVGGEDARLGGGIVGAAGGGERVLLPGVEAWREDDLPGVGAVGGDVARGVREVEGGGHPGLEFLAEDRAVRTGDGEDGSVVVPGDVPGHPIRADGARRKVVRLRRDDSRSEEQHEGQYQTLGVQVFHPHSPWFPSSLAISGGRRRDLSRKGERNRRSVRTKTKQCGSLGGSAQETHCVKIDFRPIDREGQSCQDLRNSSYEGWQATP